jgi:hypothetical protein
MSSSTPAQGVPLIRIGKDGGLILDPEAIAFYRSDAVSHASEGEDETALNKPARVPGVLATWWFHRFFDFLAYSLRDRVAYQNFTSAYTEIASVYAGLEGKCHNLPYQPCC